MNNATKQKLEIFAKSNNWQIPHPLDMERFWEFVIEAYNNGDTALSTDEFNWVIEPIYKLEEKDLIKWLIKYEDGIELLRTYSK